MFDIQCLCQGRVVGTALRCPTDGTSRVERLVLGSSMALQAWEKLSMRNMRSCTHMLVKG